MHTTKGPGGTVFHHNGDYSGDVVIQFDAPTESGKGSYMQSPDGDLVNWRIEVPFADVRALVLGYLRDKRISELEDAGDGELEKLLFR
jgi:hypothetical protein